MQVDTIASLSTAPGIGAIAIVRVSGPAALAVLQGLVPELCEAPEARRPLLATLVDPEDGAHLDRAIVTWLPGPASYTGEDMAELSCHGGWLVPQLVLDAAVRSGARRAEPGEFTRRAYLRGKLDLVQVEAVADLIEARGRALHRAAMGQLERGLSARLAELRERLVGLEALLAHHIDFPEEDDPPVPLSRIGAEAAGVVEALDRMLATAPEGELLREGAVTVFAGRPNAGKSSLYNALLGQERAIVTDVPGTTRDALEATVQLGGFPFRLVDTAGLRETEEAVERLGIEVAMRFVDRADVVLLCVPSDEGLTEGDLAFLERVGETPVVVVETKADRVEGGGEGQPSGAAELGGAKGAEAGATDVGELGLAGCVRVSVVSGQGLDQLRTLLPELAYRAVVTAAPETPIVTRARQARGLRLARAEVDAFRTALEAGLPPDVAATHLRPAETALEELLGIVSVDDVLDVVFRDFCVGK